MRALAVLFLPVLLLACPVSKTPEELGKATPIEAPVEATPVLLSSVESQIPKGIDDYQVLMIEWQGMKPHAAHFERFVRGACFVQGRYVFAEGGLLVPQAPLYRATETGTAMHPGEIVFSRASTLARGPKLPEIAHERSPTGALSWVWQEQADGNERIWTVTYPETVACVAPGVLSRDTIPAKMKPTLRRAGPLPGETVPAGPAGPKSPGQETAKVPSASAETTPAE